MTNTGKLTRLLNLTTPGTSTNGRQQYTLQGEETINLGGGHHLLHVVSGEAWITLEGKDILLAEGNNITLAATREAGLVSSAKLNKPVTLEVFPLQK